MAGPTTPTVDIFDYVANPVVTSSAGQTYGTFPGAGGVGLSPLQADGSFGYSSGAAGQGYIVGADGVDCECWGYVSTVPGTGGTIDFAFGLIDIGSVTTIDGYAARVTKNSGGADDVLALYRITNLAATLLVSVVQEFSNGNGLLGRRTGTTLELDYYNGSTWTNLLSTTDGTYTSGGVKGLTIGSSSARIDEWGGGTQPAAGGQPIQLRGNQVPGLRQWTPKSGRLFKPTTRQLWAFNQRKVA